MKKITKILSLLLSVLFLFSIGVGCKNDEVEIIPSSGTYKSDFSMLYGIGETPFELCPDVDAGLTNEWICHTIKAMGIKTYRIWAYIDYLFTVDENDNVTMNQEYAAKIKKLVSDLRNAGVEKISLMTASRLLLVEYQRYSHSCVPDPTANFDDYMRALAVEERAYEIMAREFDVDYFENINEPDHTASSAINKPGYVYNPADSSANSEFIFTRTETARICMDFCWYARRGLKRGNPNAKLLLPALCHFADSPQFLELCYKQIYSKGLPAGQEYSDIDPDNYFDALNWHPYANTMFGVEEIPDELWVARQNEFHDIAVKYGDAEKPTWFTEYGFSDGNSEYITGSVDEFGQYGQAPEGFIKMFDLIKKELPWVEAVCMFRMTDMYTRKYDAAADGENHFGMFYNKEDPINKGKPKPSAVAVARYIRGGTISYDDMVELCRYYYDAFGDIPEEYKCVVSN